MSLLTNSLTINRVVSLGNGEVVVSLPREES